MPLNPGGHYDNRDVPGARVGLEAPRQLNAIASARTFDSCHDCGSAMPLDRIHGGVRFRADDHPEPVELQVLRVHFAFIRVSIDEQQGRRIEHG